MSVDEVELIPELSITERLSVEAIAREHELPVIEVARLYKVERASIEEAAKLMTYVPVITQRLLRIKLKVRHH